MLTSGRMRRKNKETLIKKIIRNNKERTGIIINKNEKNKNNNKNN